jgi:hypothetical protein
MVQISDTLDNHPNGAPRFTCRRYPSCYDRQNTWSDGIVRFFILQLNSMRYYLNVRIKLLMYMYMYMLQFSLYLILQSFPGCSLNHAKIIYSNVLLVFEKGSSICFSSWVTLMNDLQSPCSLLILRCIYITV